MSFETSTRYYWLSREPRILWHTERNVAQLNLQLPPEPIIRLLQFQWDVSAQVAIGTFMMCRRDKDRCLLIAHSETQYATWSSMGLPAVYVHQNAWLDENIYTIGSEPKRFDAVLNARAEKWKQPELAADIPSLCAISPRTAETDPLLDEIRHAEIVPKTLGAWLSPEATVPYLQQSHVGLSLSMLEGGSFVIGEYQLCGLPVVMTYNPTRGKLGWVEMDFSRVVPPTKEAVAKAVRDFLACMPPAELVRAAAIRKALDHRHRFTDVLQDILWQHGHPQDIRLTGIYQRMFKTVIGSWREIGDLMKNLETDCG